MLGALLCFILALQNASALHQISSVLLLTSPNTQVLLSSHPYHPQQIKPIYYSFSYEDNDDPIHSHLVPPDFLMEVSHPLMLVVLVLVLPAYCMWREWDRPVHHSNDSMAYLRRASM